MRPYESSAPLSSHAITPALHPPRQRKRGLTANSFVNDVSSTGSFTEMVSEFPGRKLSLVSVY